LFRSHQYPHPPEERVVLHTKFACTPNRHQTNVRRLLINSRAITTTLASAHHSATATASWLLIARHRHAAPDRGYRSGVAAGHEHGPCHKRSAKRENVLAQVSEACLQNDSWFLRILFGISGGAVRRAMSASHAARFLSSCLFTSPRPSRRGFSSLADSVILMHARPCLVAQLQEPGRLHRRPARTTGLRLGARRGTLEPTPILR
jgi:hypothetical protein